jgi:hypothetical protein
MAAIVAGANSRNESGSGIAPPQLKLQPFSEGATSWRELLASCAGVTLYHREPWTTLLTRAYGLSLWLLLLEEGNEVVAGCLFAQSPISRRFTSLSFSDECPPLSKRANAERELLEQLTERAGAHTTYEVRGIGGVAGWKTVECFANWRLDLDRPLGRIESGLALNFRRNLKRASRQAITIERGNSKDLLKRFYTMQLQSRRRMGLPPQPWHFFDLTRDIFGAGGNFEVWMAQENAEDVASAVFLTDGDVVYYKWGARRSNYRSFANHLLFWNAIEEFARRARILDLGRADIRNQGLMRFKAELGASSATLPFSYFPRAPKQVSPEVLTGGRAFLAGIWSRMPMAATKLAGRFLYRYLG